VKNRFWKWMLLWLGLALAYFVAARLCISASAVVANISWMPFIPAGLALAAALLWGPGVWPGVFLGELAATLASNQPWGVALGMSAGNAAECALAGWWFHDRLGRRIEFDRLHDVAALLVAEMIVLQPLSTAVGILSLFLGGRLPTAEISAAAAAWYAANLIAIFVVAPAVLVWMRWSRPAVTRAQALELGVVTVLTVLVGAFGAGRWAFSDVPISVALIAVVPLLVWAAIRFVPTVAITLGTILGSFAFDAILAGTRPSLVAGGNHIFYLNVFMGVCIGTSLLLASAMGDLRRREAERQRLIDELQGAAEQVKRLEEIVTVCAWTGRIRWNEQWISIEQYLHDRFGVNVSHGISDEALKALRDNLPPPSSSGAGPPG
jgi:integral membrane sensor domain MASE1